MRTHIIGSIAAIVAYLTATAASVSEDAPSATAAQLAAQTMAVIEVIAENHITAPPKQELVRQTVVVIRRLGNLDPPLGIGPRLSAMTESADLRSELTREWAQAISQLERLQSPKHTDQVFREVIGNLLNTIPGHPGHNALRPANEQKVERQLAANRYVGTGIQLSGARDGNPPVMEKVFPNGPAEKAGALDADVILEIDGTLTEGLSLAEVVKMLRGPGGSDVEVLLQQQKEDPRRYTITRGVVPIQHTHADRQSVDGKSIETIRFDRLTSATVSDLRKIEQQWESPPDAILLDLQISGSDLHQSVLLADALLDGGLIGRLETVAGTRKFEASRGAVFAGLPMFVLVSRHTSGTIEWIAAALQDQGRATIIGEQTPGRPHVSEPYEVPGTDWVLTLSSGVLKRADGRRLLRTSLPTDRPVVLAVRPKKDFAKTRQQAKHDGGVAPTHSVDRPVMGSLQSFPRRPTNSVQEGLKQSLLMMIRHWLDQDATDRQEVD